MRYPLYVLALALSAVAPAAGQTQPTPWRGENLQFFPKDAGRRTQAILRYRATLAKNPQHQAARKWLTELTKL